MRPNLIAGVVPRRPPLRARTARSTDQAESAKERRLSSSLPTKRAVDLSFGALTQEGVDGAERNKPTGADFHGLKSS